MDNEMLRLLMAINPQAMGGYMMDEGARQRGLDQTSGNALASYMDDRASRAGMLKILNYIQAGIGIPAGAVMTATGDPMIGLPTLAWGGMGLTGARDAKNLQQDALSAAEMWRSNPMARNRLSE